MQPGFHELQSFVRGDTWIGISSISITSNGIPPVADVVSATIEFKARKSALEVLSTLSTIDDSILITDASLWTFSVPSQDLDLPAGKFYYDMQTIDTNGTVKTYIEGTITVLQDITT